MTNRLKYFIIFLLNLTTNQQALKMQEVPRENLVPGKEYYLQCFCRGCVPPNEPYIMIAKFEKLGEFLIKSKLSSIFSFLKLLLCILRLEVF